MRFIPSSLLALALGGSNLASAFGPLPSPKCLQFKNVVEDIDMTVPMDMWLNKVCSTGCQPKVSDYESVFRKSTASFIGAEAERMGVPDLAPSYVALVDGFHKMTLEKCGADRLPGGNLCLDADQMQEFGKCFQRNIWKVMLDNIVDGSPLLSADACEKEIEYFSNPRFIQEVVPAFLDKYAAEAC